MSRATSVWWVPVAAPLAPSQQRRFRLWDGRFRRITPGAPARWASSLFLCEGVS